MEYKSSTLQTTKHLPLNGHSITPQMVLKAEKELNETPERKQEGLKELRRLINAEKDFRPRMDETFLLSFLRARKYDSDTAVKTLKNYYTFKARYSGALTDIKPTEMKHVFDINMFTVLPHRDEEGSVVGVARIAPYTLDKASIDDLFAAVLICTEELLKNETTQICGSVVLIDLKGLTLRLVRQFASPTLLYRIVRALQDCMPIRVKAIHIINEPFYFSIVFTILKSILSEKMRNRFQLHGSNLTKLHNQVPPEILPNEFGGMQEAMNNNDFVKPILESDSYFDKIMKYGYQEKRAQFIRKKSSMAFGLFL